MAQSAGIPVTPHSANLLLVTVFTLHLLGAIAGAGPYVEFSIEEPDHYPWRDGLFAPAWWHGTARSKFRTGPDGGSRSTRDGSRTPPTSAAGSTEPWARSRVPDLSYFRHKSTGSVRIPGVVFRPIETGRTTMTDDVRAGAGSGVGYDLVPPARDAGGARPQAAVRAARCLLGAVAVAALTLACGSAGAADSKAASATTAADLGGMDQLVAAAKKEGELNVIALPPDWANYGTMIETFTKKYGIKINSAQPDGSSQDEINAANQLKGQARTPDVFDLGSNVALRDTNLLRPLQGRDLGRHPRRAQGPEGRPGSATTAATCRSATMAAACRRRRR